MGMTIISGMNYINIETYKNNISNERKEIEKLEQDIDIKEKEKENLKQEYTLKIEEKKEEIEVLKRWEKKLKEIKDLG